MAGAAVTWTGDVQCRNHERTMTIQTSTPRFILFASLEKGKNDILPHAMQKTNQVDQLAQPADLT
jgi:hypothetical protein